MKKWLVGLLAAGLCAASAVADTVTDTLNYAFTGISGTGYAEWSGKTSESDAVYAGQSGGANNSIQLRSNNSNSGIVTTQSGGKARKVTVTWQSSTTSGRTLNVYGKSAAYSQATDLYNASNQGTLIGTIVYGSSTELSISDDYEFIGMRSDSGAMYLSEVKIDWEVASSAQSVTLSPAGPIDAEVGDEVIITATADGFSGDVTWSWTGSGTPDGNRFTVDTSAAFEAATITATATYGTDETASQSVTVTVTAPKHAITIDSTIQNGTVTTDPEDEAAEGATVTITATADSGYKLGSILVNDVALAAGINTFTMPSQDVTVSATFVELSGDVLTQANTTTTSGYTSWTLTGASGAKYAGTTAGGNSSIQLNNGSNRGLVITESNGRNVTSVTVEWNANTTDGRTIQIYGSDTAYTGPSELYDSDARGDLLGELAKGETTLNVTGEYPYIGIISKSGALYLTSVTIEFAPVAVVPTVTLTPSTAEVNVGDPLTITATAENFSGAVEWDWLGDDDGSFVGNVYTVDTSVAGTFEIVAQASFDSERADAMATVTVLAPPELHDVVVMTDGNGTAEADVDEALPGTTITVTATPNADCRLDAITVNDEPITGTSFVMPNEDALVYVTFEAKHDIEVFAGDHGQASADMDKAYAGETVTLTVTPDAGYAKDTIKVNDEVISGTSFEMPAEDALVEVTFKEVVTYTLVESADDVVVGADYVIVASGSGFTEALKNAANGTRIGTEAVTVSDDGKTIENPSDAIIWQIKPGAHKGQRGLFNAAANVYAAAPGTAGNNAQLLADGTDALAQWTIDLSALPEVKIYSVSYDDRYLQRNNTAGNHYFATYSSAQATPRLYRADSVELQTVTFDPNGGTYYDDMLTMKYVKGGQYWGVWKPAAREGYKFLGWFDEDGARVQNGQIITEDDTRTFTAQWVQLQTVTFDANGGTLRGMESKEFRCDGVYAGFAMPLRDGYTFMGWFSEDGERVLNGEAVTDDAARTLYAHWGQTVHFDGNGGTVRQAARTFDTTGVYAGFVMPTRDGWTFLGWFDENDQRVKNGEDVTEDGERTLYAHWKESATSLSISGFSVASRSAPAARDARSGGGQAVNLRFETVAGFVYEVQWVSALDGDWTVLKRWTAEDGVSEVTVSVPSDSPSGFLRLAMFDEVE